MHIHVYLRIHICIYPPCSLFSPSLSLALSLSLSLARARSLSLISLSLSHTLLLVTHLSTTCSYTSDLLRERCLTVDLDQVEQLDETRIVFTSKFHEISPGISLIFCFILSRWHSFSLIMIAGGWDHSCGRACRRAPQHAHSRTPKVFNRGQLSLFWYKTPFPALLFPSGGRVETTGGL